MPTPTDDNRELLTVIAFKRAAAGKREELKAALEALIEPTKQEDGCVNYDLHQGRGGPDFFTFYENWVSGEKLNAHLAAPHLIDFAAKMGDLLDDQGLSINRVRRIARDLCSRPPANSAGRAAIMPPPGTRSAQALNPVVDYARSPVSGRRSQRGRCRGRAC